MFWLRVCKATFYLFYFMIYVERQTVTKIEQRRNIPFSCVYYKNNVNLVYEANIAHYS